jgi:RHS repeat-associated protein
MTRPPGLVGTQLAFSAVEAGRNFDRPVALVQVTTDSCGKERDAETGLDYFGARYLSSAQGRWTTPDWSSKPQPVPYAKLTDPETLNLYAYVRNNPLSRTDLDGHATITCQNTPGLCAAIRDSVSNGGSIQDGWSAYSSSQAKGGAAAAAFGTGALLVNDANVRANYVAQAKGALTDRGQWSAVRAGARAEARAATSGIGTGVTAMADSAEIGLGGFTATNTRQSINALAENGGTFGRGLMAVGVAVAVADVATAPEGQRGRTAAGETGALVFGWGAAWAGAEVGAGIGSFFPGPGTLIGGAVGGLVGGYFGGKAGHDVGTQAYDDIVY